MWRKEYTVQPCFEAVVSSFSFKVVDEKHDSLKRIIIDLENPQKQNFNLTSMCKNLHLRQITLFKNDRSK